MFFDTIKKQFEGEILNDISSKIRYSTDASVYKEMPLGVAFPKNQKDIVRLIHFAKEKHITLIPRAAGTSLAGQVVGNGLVVDISKYFVNILEINAEKEYAIVQPGVVRDELNLKSAPYHLFFAPETATSNRCRIGGMCGNNSCGANSLIYGSTRQHIISLKAILSDGSEVEFKELSENEFVNKCLQDNLEGTLYRQIKEMLSDDETQEEIRKEFPDKEIKRRSMGYAVDELIEMQPFSESGNRFNFCSLLVGSEGTLAFITEIKVKLSPLPAQHKALLSIQSNSMEDALEGNIVALKYSPASIELIDNTILELAKLNITQNKNRFFIKGDPAAIIIIEIIEESEEKVISKINNIISALQNAGLVTYSTVIQGDEMNKVWALRKAGLGILSNLKGDAKPVTVVEDIAIQPNKYPLFYKEFKALLNKFGLKCAFYAHISTGELHNKPIFNLKDKEEVEKFRQFAYETALLVKKLGGMLSGEHGDGRLRGEFLSLMVGDKNYRLLQQIKALFDPENIFNTGKIIDVPRMNTHLRYENHTENENISKKYSISTIFDFSDTDGLLRAIEKCNGSADCKKSHLFEGTMCPSYQATLDEKNSTRARANILREYVTNSRKKNPFDHKEIIEILDLCLACKACKSECPSNVDMTKLRVEFLFHYYQQHPVPFRSRIIANYPAINKLGTHFSGIYNFLCTNSFCSSLLKFFAGFSQKRSLPIISSFSLKTWAKKNIPAIKAPIRTVYFFNDEFTNTQDVRIGITAIKLLSQLHYQVKILDNHFSGRTFLSKGDLKKAKKLAEKNVKLFSGIIDKDTPLIGLEPSAILTFRDEYPELIGKSLKEDAKSLAKNSFLIDEFISDEYENGHIDRNLFTINNMEILFHSHCYQKALSDVSKSIVMMEIPFNYKVREIKSGCCGMAGAFGYEKEHYDLSMKIGELTLFPEIRSKNAGTVLTATGTSCRHQIKDGTGEKALHPVEILYNALIK
jgi:FAD/FMN-containing dehydrogenase/Fe-S oxidoreductase